MYFNFSIINFFTKKDKWEKYIMFYRRLSKNKHLEIETFYSNSYLLQVEFKFTSHGEDHAGLRFNINLFGWELDVSIYDSRHWDYKNWCWKKPTEEEMLNKNFDGF